MTQKERDELVIIEGEVVSSLPKRQELLGLITGFSKGFISEIQQLLPYVKISTKIKKSTSYDLIIKATKEHLTFDEISRQSTLLKKDGVMVLFANNPRIRTAKSSTYSLSRLSDRHLATRNLETVFREPYGKFQQFNRLTHPKFHKLTTLIRSLPNSKIYSPYIAVILRLSHQYEYTRYRERTSLASRLFRVGHRNPLMQPFIKLFKSNWLSRKDKIIYHRALNSISTINSAGRKPILICMTYLNMGGVERVMLNIIKGLDRKKFSIHIMTTEKSHNPWLPQFQKFADNIILLPKIIEPEWPDWCRTEYISRYVVDNEIATVLITNSNAAYRATKKIKESLGNRIKIYDLLHTHGTPKDRDAFLRTSMPFDKFIDKRIVISQYLKKYYIERYPVDPDKIQVIYNGIDSSVAKNTTRKPVDPIFAKIPKKHKVITYIGRLDVDKTPMRLVNIAHQLKQQKILASLLVVGNGSEYAKMKEKAQTDKTLNKFIFFYGQSSSPNELIKHSNFTINVSNSEGISMSILESMNLGVPVIASKVGGTPEIIDHKKDGVLVDINSKDAETDKVNLFVEAIRWTIGISDKQKFDLGKMAEKKIRSRFSHATDEYEKLL
ncbi:MAG: glycosyltransferase [Candidatus Nanosyncoccaceae bacterium]